MKPNFLWGVATSSHQIEGDNKHNDWWAWEAEGRIDGGVRSGRAADHWNRMREDLLLTKSLGLNTYRFSFEWSRFEPNEGEWNRDAAEWYAKLVATCEELELLPMATLHHFTTPKWLADRGGIASEDFPEMFARFTRNIAREFGPRIPMWCTLNEPMVLIMGAYVARFMPPGEYRPKEASKACSNMLSAHVLAYDILKKEIVKREGPFRDHPLMVGYAHNMIRFKPHRKTNFIERGLAWLMNSRYNDSWIRATNGGRQRFGMPGVFRSPPELKSARGRRTFDFIGVNYYTKAYIEFRPKTQSKERDARVPIAISFARRKERASDLGWAVYPKGLGIILESLRQYDCPIYITENGIADAQDEKRSDYLVSHLKQVASAIESGLDIRGYYHWSLIDNFEWIKGFWPRFGLIHVNYDTFARTERESARIYRSLAQRHAGQAPRNDLLT